MPSASPRSAGAAPSSVDIRALALRAVVLPLVLMAVVAGCLGWQIGRLSGAAARVDRADRVIAQAELAERLILDQQAGLRGYLVAQDRVFLQHYDEAQPEQALDALERLAADAPPQALRVEAMRARYRAWLDAAARAIQHPDEGASTTSQLARKGQMDAIRAQATGLVAAEEAARAALGRRADEERWLTAAGATVLLAAVGGALAVSTRRNFREIARRYDDALERSTASEAALGRLLERERDARRQAQDALRVKDEFLSTLSHELRTPLTAILGWAGMLGAKSLPPEVAVRAIAVIERNAKAQAQIVDDLLDVSRIVAGKFRLRLADTDLSDVVRAALDVVRFPAEAKGVAITAELGPAALLTRADPDRLEQVVWNLLGNAVKFTPKGGRITVTLGREGSRAELRVSDTGEGIAPDLLPYVFERFRQGDSSMKRPHGGLGLGLAIVKHLVELHGGEARAESPGPGRGAVFTITLPLAAVGEAARAKVEAVAEPAETRRREPC